MYQFGVRFVRIFDLKIHQISCFCLGKKWISCIGLRLAATEAKVEFTSVRVSVNFAMAPSEVKFRQMCRKKSAKKANCPTPQQFWSTPRQVFAHAPGLDVSEVI